MKGPTHVRFFAVAVLAAVLVTAGCADSTESPEQRTSRIGSRLARAIQEWRVFFEMTPPGSTPRPTRNRMNMGAEGLYYALMFHPGPWSKTIKGIATADTDTDELFEFVDAWGHPIVFMPVREHDRIRAKGATYINAQGETVSVQLRLDAQGKAVGHKTYQLLSIGPDGVPGNDDDLILGE